MSTGSGAVQCPQCGWEEANEEYNGRTCGHRIVCRRCGYCESEIPKFDKKRHFRGSTHKVEIGAGALGYQWKGGFGYIGCALRKSAAVTRAADWLPDKLKIGAVEDTAYVTRWSFETKQVETIRGQFYLDPEQIEHLLDRDSQQPELNGDENSRA
jgi:hypothetical protein